MNGMNQNKITTGVWIHTFCDHSFSSDMSDIKIQIAVEGIRHNIWTCVVLFLQKHPFVIGFFPTGLLRIAGVLFGGNR